MTPTQSEKTLASAERAFLVNAARLGLNLAPAVFQIPDPSPAGMDWRRIASAASDHAMPQLLAMACRPRSDVPAPVAALLARRSAYLAVSTMDQSRQLVSTMNTLERAGLRALAVKGPALAALAYPNPILRPSVDLDILVSTSEAQRAVAALASAGFKHDASCPAPAGDLRLDNEQTLISPDGRTTVELHWALLPMGHSLPSTFDELWNRAQIVRLATGPVRTLGLEDLFLYLCQHGTKHGWERLMWVCDLAMLAAHFTNAAWEALLNRCRMAGTLRMVLLGLSLARNLLGIRLPPAAGRAIAADSNLRTLSARVEHRMFEDASRTEGLWAHTRSLVFNLAVRERLRDRIRFCLWAVKPTIRDYGSIRLAGPLSLLYFVLRPLRLLVRHATPRAWPGHV